MGYPTRRNILGGEDQIGDACRNAKGRKRTFKVQRISPADRKQTFIGEAKASPGRMGSSVQWGK